MIKCRRRNSLNFLEKPDHLRRRSSVWSNSKGDELDRMIHELHEDEMSESDGDEDKRLLDDLKV